jgi:hypothetical protein
LVNAKQGPRRPYLIAGDHASDIRIDMRDIATDRYFVQNEISIRMHIVLDSLSKGQREQGFDR